MSPNGEIGSGTPSTGASALDERIRLEERLLGAHRKAAASPPPIPRRADGNCVEPSFAQSRLWVVEQLGAARGNYHIARAWRIRGTLNPEALRAALDAVVSRHEALRTRLVMREGALRQQIEAHRPFELRRADLRTLPESARESSLNEFLRRVARDAFDLSADCMLRAGIAQLGDREHAFVVTLHHIAADGWSLNVLDREIETLYSAFDRGVACELPPLPIQYSDYSLWQRERLQGAVLERQLAYWRTQLADLTTLELPTDHPRPPVQSHRGACHPLALSAGLTAALKQLSQRERVTLYMTLLAAFQVLLARYSGQDDIAIGSPIAGRSQRELEGLIGFFVNTLVLRSDLSGNPRFRDLLARVRETALDAYAHQELPFEKLVEELSPERDMSRNPLIQVMFALQNVPHAELTLPGLETTRLDLDTTTAKFDLTLSLTEQPEGLSGVIEYATDLFDATTIARLAGHFTTLLEGTVADPETPIAELPLLTAAEREQLLVQWNDTAVDYPRDRCIHQLFEQQVARTPDATAVVFEDTSLTYAELNARANQLAHHLITLGVGPDVLVGLCLERSLDLVVGLLGILKAGGAYVPLDPGYPAARLAFMLEDTQAPVLLTQHKLLGQLPPYAGRVLCLDRDPSLLAAQPDTDPPCRATAENLAYVIYTSGSTGNPKGVMIEHANVVRLFSATQHWFAFGEHDVWTCFHSAAFDFSVWEIWGALLHGGRLVMVPYLVSRDPDAFHALLRRERVTVLNQTPSAFGQLIAADARVDTAALRSLRLVIFGGEALEMQSLRPWFERHGDAQPQLVNMYGITETTVHVTYRPAAQSGPGRLDRQHDRRAASPTCAFTSWTATCNPCRSALRARSWSVARRRPAAI